MDKPVIAQLAPAPVDVEAGKDYFWCSCGKSKAQPFCDGSHKDTGKTPVKFDAIESKPLDGKVHAAQSSATENTY